MTENELSIKVHEFEQWRETEGTKKFSQTVDPETSEVKEYSYYAEYPGMNMILPEIHKKIRECLQAGYRLEDIKFMYSITFFNAENDISPPPEKYIDKFARIKYKFRPDEPTVEKAADSEIPGCGNSIPPISSQKQEPDIQTPEAILELKKGGHLELGDNGKYNIVGKPFKFLYCCGAQGYFEAYSLDAALLDKWVNHGYKNMETLESSIRRAIAKSEESDIKDNTILKVIDNIQKN
jgi:hypothetical protein